MFNKIVGNNRIKESLGKIISSGNISHSYIFSGPEGIREEYVCKRFCKSHVMLK